MAAGLRIELRLQVLETHALANILPRSISNYIDFASSPDYTGGANSLGEEDNPLWRRAEVPTPMRLITAPTVFKTELRAVAVNPP